MAESGIPYELITPGGTIIFNDWEQPAVIHVADVSGLTPDVRKSVKVKPRRPGVKVGRGQLGGMQPVLSGDFLHTGPASQESMRSQLMRAAYSLVNEWGTLRWKPSNADSWREVQVQLLERPDVQGGLIKTWQLMLVTDEPFIYGEFEHVETSAYYSLAGGGGLTFPLAFPIIFTEQPFSGSGTFTNSGENDSYPIISVEGPITSPAVRNITTGLTLQLTGVSLIAGETAVIDMLDETVYKNGSISSPLMQYIDFTTSDFFPLVPGPNALQLIGSSPDPSSTRFVVTWKDSYL